MSIRKAERKYMYTERTEILGSRRDRQEEKGIHEMKRGIRKTGPGWLREKKRYFLIHVITTIQCYFLTSSY